MSKYISPSKLLELAEKAGLKIPILENTARAIAEKKAADAGLVHTVYHASPHAFSSINPGSDELIHVATDPEVALQRLSDVGALGDEAQFNLSPEEMKRMGIDRDTVKKAGHLFELKTNLGNPLTVSDMGDFSLNNLMQDPNVLEHLDPATSRKLYFLNAQSKNLENELYEIPTFLSNKPSSEVVRKQEEIKKLNSEGLKLIQDQLKNKGFDSFHYKNTVEIPNNIREKMTDIYAKIADTDSLISEAQNRGADNSEIRKLLRQKDALEDQIKGIHQELPDSYALFRDTPIRHINADFDPKKLQTNPSDLLKSLGIATGVGVAASAMMPEDAEAGVTYKANEVARILDGLKKAGKLSSGEFLKAINYSSPSTRADIDIIRKSMENALDYGLRDRAGLTMSSPNWRVNEEISKIFNPELREIFPLYEGDKAKKLMDERKIKNAAGAFLSEPTNNPYIPYIGKDISILDDSPALLHHEDQHALEYLMDPQSMHDRVLDQFFGGKQSNDVTKQTNKDLAKKLSILSKGKDSVYKFLCELNDLRPQKLIASDLDDLITEKYIKNKELKRYLNSQADKFKLGDAGHFIQYPENFELNRALEMLKDQVKVPKGSLKENKQLIDEIINNPELPINDIESRLDRIEENAQLVPSAKKSRYTLPDKMPFAIGGATLGAGMLAGGNNAEASELEENKNLNLPIKQNKEDKEPQTKTKDTDYSSKFGETTGSVMNYLKEKLAPLTAKNAEEGDYTPINLLHTPDAPLRAASAVGEIADIPAAYLRKHIYNVLSGNEAEKASGHDIINALEENVGSPMPSIPKASFGPADILGYGTDIALDPIMLPGGKILKYLKDIKPSVKTAQEGMEAIKAIKNIDSREKILQTLKGQS